MHPVAPHHTLLQPSLLTWESADAVELVLQLTAPGPRRPPRTVVLALDASQAVFEAARHAMVVLIDALGAEDRLGVVSFSREAVLMRPAVRIGDGIDAIERLHEIERAGFANLSAGAFRAITEARRTRENAWRAAWERAHARPNLELAAVLERLGPCDADRPPTPDRVDALLKGPWRLGTMQRRLLEAAFPVDVVLVADGDPGRGEEEHALFGALGARARAHGVRVSTVATSEDLDWEERLALLASRSGGRHRLCEHPDGLEHDVDVAGRGEPEPIAAQAVTARLRPAVALGDVDAAGRMRRIDHDGEVLVDLGDLRAGEVRQVGLRIDLGVGRGRRRRRRARAERGHRDLPEDDLAMRADDGPGVLARLEVEWLVAGDGAHERVRLPVHRGLVPGDAAAAAEPARAWREPMPDDDHWEAEALGVEDEPDEATRAEDAVLREADDMGQLRFDSPGGRSR